MFQPQNLVLVGGGGTAADVLSLIDDCNEAAKDVCYSVSGILDDNAVRGERLLEQLVLGGLDTGPELYRADPSLMFVDCLGSPSSNALRRTVLEQAGFELDAFATLIHPRASIARSAQIGAGTLIFANVTVLSKVILGRHVTILANSVLNHDVSIGDFSILASNVSVSGGVSIGQDCYLGCGVNVRERVSIADRARVGLGGAVLRDVPAGQTVIGVPARPMERAP